MYNNTETCRFHCTLNTCVGFQCQTFVPSFFFFFELKTWFVSAEFTRVNHSNPPIGILYLVIVINFCVTDIITSTSSNHFYIWINSKRVHFQYVKRFIGVQTIIKKKIFHWFNLYRWQKEKQLKCEIDQKPFWNKKKIEIA